MRELRVIVGTTYDLPDGYTKEVDQEAFREFEARLARDYGGYTKTGGLGAWLNPNGFVVREKCFVYDVIATSEQPLRNHAKALCARANQHAVMFRGWNGDVSFLRGEGFPAERTYADPSGT